MTISLTVITVVLFSLIVGFRLFSVRDEIRDTGEESAKIILRKAEIAFYMSDVNYLENYVGTNGFLVDKRFAFMNDMLKCLKAQVRETYDREDTSSGMDAPLHQQIVPAVLFMKEIMKEDPDAIDYVTVSFPDGQSVVMDHSSDNKTGEAARVLPYDARKERWYLDALENRETCTVSGSSLPGEDTECITLSTAVFDEETGAPVCVLGVSVKTERILDIIRSNYDQEGIYPVLIDKNGTILYSIAPDGHFAEADALTKNGALDDSTVDFITDYSGDLAFSFDVEVDGRPFYACFIPIPNAGWTELVFIETDLFEADTNQLVDDMRLITDRNIEVSDRSFMKILTQMLVLSVILIGLSILVSILLSGRITKPVKRMTQKASEIDGEKILFEMEDIFRTGDEIETLAVTFESMSQKIRQYITDIVGISTQKERMETELKVAADIQAAMLPKDFPLFPDRTEFDVYATMDPAREVGGDFYDIFMVDEDHLALVVGDASEKGVPAALFMVITKAYIKTRALTGGSPGEILTDVNKLLAEGNEKKMFATVWLAILEISTGRLVYANAGHEKLVIKRAGGDFALDHSKHGFILGGMKGVSYSDEEITLCHGDRIFMYTDGLTEAHKNIDDLFGSGRMLDVLNNNSALKTAELLSAVKSEVNAFVGDAPAFDDMTMLALEIR